MKRWAHAAIALVCCSPRDVDLGYTGDVDDGAGRRDLGWEDEGLSGPIVDLPSGEDCEVDIRFESWDPHFAWVIEQSTAMRSDSWDFDHDPQTPEQSAWSYTLGFLAEYAARVGSDEPCGADYETSFVFSPSIAGGGEPDGCSVDSTAPPLVFNTEATMLDIFELADATGLGGGNPLAGAHQAAVERLLEDSHGTGDYVILFAHSPPNCGDGQDVGILDPELLASVTDAHAMGILTYVVGVGVEAWVSSPGDGVPNGDAVAYFDTLAVAGGRPSYDVHDYWEPDENFLYEVAPNYGGGPCVVPLDPAPPLNIPDEDLEVYSQGVRYPFLEDGCYPLPEGVGGWVWVNWPDTIQLCGDACRPDDGACYPAHPHMRGHLEVRWPCERRLAPMPFT